MTDEFNGYTVFTAPTYTGSDAGYEYELWDASCPGPNYPVLKRGSTGDCVRLAQSRLARHGFLPVSSVDGKFGPQTEVAVKAFQRAKGLAVDGIIGPRTWEKLMEPPEAQPPQEPPTAQPPGEQPSPNGEATGPEGAKTPSPGSSVVFFLLGAAVAAVLGLAVYQGYQRE